MIEQNLTLQTIELNNREKEAKLRESELAQRERETKLRDYELTQREREAKLREQELLEREKRFNIKSKSSDPITNITPVTSESSLITKPTITEQTTPIKSESSAIQDIVNVSFYELSCMIIDLCSGITG